MDILGTEADPNRVQTTRPMPFATATLPTDVGDTDLMRVEDALRALPGVKRVYLSRAVEMVYVVYDAAYCDVGTLEATIHRRQVPPPVPVLAEKVMNPLPATGSTLWTALRQVLRRRIWHAER